jgi:tetratricopeptide (TPR) repeat protein
MPEAVEQQPELVAHHLAEGREPASSIEYWQRAGDRALARLAGHEARAHFESGLELLEALPDRASRDRAELALRLGLGAAGAVRYEWANEDTARAWRRALELADRLGDNRARARALWGRSAVHLLRSELRECLRLAIELRDTARALGDIWQELAGWNHIVVAHFMLGEPEAALDQLDRMLVRDPVTEADPSWYAYGGSQRMMARLWGAHSALACGYTERAAALCDEAIAMAKELPSPQDFCTAVMLTNAVRKATRQTEALRANTEAALAIAEEHDLEIWIGVAQMDIAGADAVEGIGGADPAAAFSRGLDRIGSPSGIHVATYVMLMHADVLRRVGRLGEAEEWAKYALAFAEAKEQHYCTAELHRILGEISLGRDDPDPAEAARHFERALEVARSQHARFYELRAATSLARLLRDQGRRDEARALLQPVYAWFTEGFDTAPLKEAKALLEELQ